MYQVILLSTETLKASTRKYYPEIIITQIKTQTLLIGLFPRSTMEALIIDKSFEKTPLIEQVLRFSPKCLVITLPGCNTASSYQCMSIDEALQRVIEIGKPKNKETLPFNLGLQFLKTLTNPLLAIRLDGPMLNLYKEYSFFVCIALNEKNHLFPLMYKQFYSHTRNCIGYQISNDSALFIFFELNNLKTLTNHYEWIIRYYSSDRSVPLFIGTIQKALEGVYNSYFEAYVTYYTNKYFSSCRTFDDVSQPTISKSKDIIDLETEIRNSMLYKQGRNVIPLVSQWFDIYQTIKFPFKTIQCEAVTLYADIKRIIFDHYVLKDKRIKNGQEVIEIINITSFDELRNWFIIWMNYTLTDFTKARTVEPEFTLSHAFAFIGSNLLEDCSLTSLADSFGMTPQYVSTRFKQELGRPFVSYVTEMKMQKAGELLLSTETVSETAKMLGYNDSKYFRSIFKKYWNQTPREYKKQKLLRVKKTTYNSQV